MQTVFIAISVAVLVVVAILVFLTDRGRQRNRLSPLAGLAFAFVVAGILFGEERIVGYGLMGFGVLLALVDIFAQARGQ